VPTPQPSNGSAGLWLTPAEIAKLPTSGSTWEHLKSAADSDLGQPNIADQNSKHDTNTLAAALVSARTGDARYRFKFVAQLTHVDSEIMCFCGILWPPGQPEQLALCDHFAWA
jgi:hypothetical protein